MSQKISFQIDRFLVIFGTVLLALSIITILSLKTILSSVITSRQVDDELLQSSIPRLNKEDIDKAFEITTKKGTMSLDLHE